jgi:Co/Zn/Cd efflux system component
MGRGKKYHGLCYTIFSFMCMFCRSLFVLLSFFAIVLSVLRFTDSYYPFRLWYLETLLGLICGWFSIKIAHFVLIS